jgi:circadian clock protein KaiC
MTTANPEDPAQISTGNAEPDRRFGGGLKRGANAVLIGSAGVGKPSVVLTNAIAAADCGEHAVYFAFDEGRAAARCAGP